MREALDECLAELEAQLAPSSVSTVPADLEAHSRDCWPLGRKRLQAGQGGPLPAAVIRPSTPDDVATVLRLAAKHDIPVTPWGAGSSVVGQPIPEPDGISLDLGRLNAIVEIDEENLRIRVQAGAIGADVEDALQTRGLTLNFSPQSLFRSTVGGWVATRATGQFSSRWGGIENALVALTVVLPQGQVFESRVVPRAATGPDLKQLFVGSEGTLGVVTELVLRVYPAAEHRHVETIRFSDVGAGLAAMQKIMRAGLRPFLLRLYDPDEAHHAIDAPDFRGAALMLGTEGIRAVALAELSAALEICRGEGGVVLGPEGAELWMSRRYDFSAIEQVLEQPGGVAETIEVSHSWTGIRETYKELKRVLEPLATEVLGHFSHAYTDGTSLYVIVIGASPSPQAAERGLVQIWDAAMTACLATGAAISHHHGVGLARLPWLRRELGAGVDLLDTMKQAIDPDGVLCPGRLSLSVPTARPVRRPAHSNGSGDETHA